VDYDGAGSLGQARRDVLHAELPEHRVHHLHDRAARLEMLVRQHLGCTVDVAAGHAVLVQERAERLRIHGRRPLRDQVFELDQALAARGVVREARIARKLRPAHRLREPGEDGVLVGRDQDEDPVGRRVHVRGCDLRQDGARALADDAGKVEIVTSVSMTARTDS
jgi:hypothetical protein